MGSFQAVNSTGSYKAEDRPWLRAKLFAAVIHTPSPPPLPPFCSDCATKTQPAGGGDPVQSASRVWRSAEGKYRLDTPKVSVINDPAAQQTILLDHLKKEATIIPTPPAEPGMDALGKPKAPAADGHAELVKVEDLGKSMIEGHEVEGKRFTLPPFKPPAMPEMPQVKAPEAPKMSMPGVPKVPAPPGAPAPPQVPKLPPVPSVTEVWTSTKLKMPVLTKVTTTAGEQTTYCKPTSMDDPHPSVFQIPPGYKITPPKV